MRMPKVLSICWHSIEPDSANPERYEGWNTSASLFREQVRSIVDRYTPISVRQFVDMAQNGPRTTLRKPPVLLTFDDGFKSVLEYALPILEECRVPASFFLLGEVLRDPGFVPWFIELSHMMRKTSKRTIVFNTVCIDPTSSAQRRRLMIEFGIAYRTCRTRAAGEQLLTDFAAELGVLRPAANDLDADMRFVTQRDLAQMSPSSLLTIGSHGMTHRFLDGLSHEDQRWELEQSHLLLSKLSAAYFPAFAYPAGVFNDDAVSIAQGTYECAFGLSGNASYGNVYVYPRVLVSEEKPQQMAYMISSARLHYFLPVKRVLQRVRLW